MKLHILKLAKFCRTFFSLLLIPALPKIGNSKFCHILILPDVSSDGMYLV